MVTVGHTQNVKKAPNQGWRENYGYDVRKALIDLRCYRNCIRNEIGRGELFSESINLLIEKELVTEIPQETTAKGNAIGIPMVALTPRLRKIGRYLVARGWGS